MSTRDSRVDTGQDLSVVGLDVLDDDVTSRGLRADRLLLAITTASVELAEVLQVDDTGSSAETLKPSTREEARMNLRWRRIHRW